MASVTFGFDGFEQFRTAAKRTHKNFFPAIIGQFLSSFSIVRCCSPLKCAIPSSSCPLFETIRS